MNINEMRNIVALISFPNYAFEVSQKGEAIYLVASYFEPDIITGELELQRTRKWQLSTWMVKSEIVQTALKLALTSAEHTVREHFLYRGERIYGPHFDVEALHEIAAARRLDYRGK